MVAINTKHQRELLAGRMNDLLDAAETRGGFETAELREFDSIARGMAALDRAEGYREHRINPGDIKAAREYLAGKLEFNSRVGNDDVDHRASTRDGEDGASLLDEALAGWVRTQCGSPIDNRLANACADYGIAPTSGAFDVRMRTHRPMLGRDAFCKREQRALSGVNDSAGAYTIAEGFMASLEKALLDFSGVLQAASVMRTATGANLPWPTTDDSSNKGALIGENVAVTEQDVTFGAVVFQAYKYTSKLVRVPHELIQDSVVDLASELGMLLGERLGRIFNEHWTTGDGASKPYGVVTKSTLGVTAASATAIAADELIDLVHSVDPAYRSGSSVGFMMHDSVLKAIRKLKDGNGDYLWQQSLQTGQPSTLLGYPVWPNQDMASSIASANKTILFGDFSKYKCRMVADIRIRRLVERYADQDQEGFLAFGRIDGNLLDAGTNPIKHLKQAT